MLSDSHAHLDSEALRPFVESLVNIRRGNPDDTSALRIISNSTDLRSSKSNLELGLLLPETVIPFVGVHPEAVSSEEIKPYASEDSLQGLVEKIEDLSKRAAGVGEIGLDPKYGSDEFQARLFESQLRICEGDRTLAVSIHSRDSLERIETMLSTYRLSNNIMFHWFNGSEEQLSRLQGQGYYVSFGPTLIFSKRIQRLYQSADEELVLAETDSPVFLSSLPVKSHLSPFGVASVIFEMSRLKGRSFSEAAEQIDRSSKAFISRSERKTH